MVKFCFYCGNLLYAYYENNEQLFFMCNNCHIPYDPDVEDTLRYSRNKNNVTISIKKILNNTIDDPAVVKVYKDCIECDGKIVKQIRIGDNLDLFNICLKCKKQWLNE